MQHEKQERLETIGKIMRKRDSLKSFNTNEDRVKELDRLCDCTMVKLNSI
jgi:hypothetical protein